MNAATYPHHCSARVIIQAFAKGNDLDPAFELLTRARAEFRLDPASRTMHETVSNLLFLHVGLLLTLFLQHVVRDEKVLLSGSVNRSLDAADHITERIGVTLQVHFCVVVYSSTQRSLVVVSSVIVNTVVGTVDSAEDSQAF